MLQASDNNYYMRKNYKKDYSFDGSIFLDKDVSLELPSTNFLIYGHNNKNGTMFNDLLKYKDKDFYNQYPTIKLITKINIKTFNFNELKSYINPIIIVAIPNNLILSSSNKINFKT